MATTPSTSGAGGVLYRLDGQLRVAAFVELALARPRRDEAPGASDAATAPVAVGDTCEVRLERGPAEAGRRRRT